MSEITKGPGPVTHYADLLPLSFPEGPGNLRVPWLQGKPMKCSSSKPTSCCSTFQLHPAPEAPRGVASSFACQPGDKPPLLRLPREKNLIMVEREGSILNCWEVTSAGGHWGGDRRRWSHTSRSKLLKMTLLASCCVGSAPNTSSSSGHWDGPKPPHTSWIPNASLCPSLPKLTELTKLLGQLCLSQGTVSSLQLGCPKLAHEPRMFV